MKLINKALVGLLFLTLALGCKRKVGHAATPVLVKVIGIVDGDTYDVLLNGNKERIRVDAIDAPERGMPYYAVAKLKLAELLFSKEIKLVTKGRDKYRRIIGRAYLLDGTDVSAAMLEQGLAWHYNIKNHEALLEQLAQKAKDNKVGLWADPNPVAPWEERHRK